jgi:YbbR domain-containing protein
VGSRILGNLGLKLLSLGLGFSLWYLVAGDRGAEIVISVPVELRNMPEGLEVIRESVQHVQVRLRGSSEIVRGITPSEVQVPVDLGQARPGVQTVSLMPDLIEIPFGARVMRVSPASLTLELDRTAERQARVSPRVEGEPAAGFELAGVSVEPEQVVLTGPESHLSALKQVTTAPVSARGLRGPHAEPAHVLLEDPLVRVSGRGQVLVRLEIREERARREIGGVEVTPSSGAGRLQLSPAEVRVTVEGPKSVVQPLAAPDLVAVVETAGLAPGLHRVAPSVRRRSGGGEELEVLAVVPERVRVRISGGGKEE